MKRIYHHYINWEDYRNGFYDNCSGEEKEKHLKSVIKMFNSESLTIEYMNRVITEWRYSCEHNLTNDALNKIAYIGQAACCIYSKTPSTITMEGWNLLTSEVQDRANIIAQQTLDRWIKNNKHIQLCLNID
jgi:hypothetical protein